MSKQPLVENNLRFPSSRTSLRPLPQHVRMHQSSRQGMLNSQYLELIRVQKVYRAKTGFNTRESSVETKNRMPYSERNTLPETFSSTMPISRYDQGLA